MPDADHTSTPDVRTSDCARCGVTVEAQYKRGRWYFKEFCEPCRAQRKLERSRANMTTYRRARGVAQVKGTVIQCVRCGGDFVRDGIKRKFCDACQPEAMLERARAASQSKCRARAAIKHGTEVKCANCDMLIVKMYPRHCYCAECQKLYRRGQLSYLKEGHARWRKGRLAALRAIVPATPPNSTMRDCVCIKCQAAFSTKARTQKYCPGCAPRIYRDKANERQRVRFARRRKEDPMFALNQRMRTAVGQCLKGVKRRQSWRTLVGYGVEELFRHIERQFTHGMTWENRSEWHIDHIVPLASFKFQTAEDPDFQAAWALTNLRPLWKSDNLQKRDKRLYLL